MSDAARDTGVQSQEKMHFKFVTGDTLVWTLVFMSSCLWHETLSTLQDSTLNHFKQKLFTLVLSLIKSKLTHANTDLEVITWSTPTFHWMIFKLSCQQASTLLTMSKTLNHWIPLSCRALIWAESDLHRDVSWPTGTALHVLQFGGTCGNPPTQRFHYRSQRVILLYQH